MNDTIRRTSLALLLLASCAAGVRAQFHEEPDATEISLSGKTPESIIIMWPTYSYQLARAMIAKYGQPNESRENMLTWLDNGPWKKTVVYRDAPSGRTYKRNKGRLEQTVAYRVPPEKLDQLARFDKSVEAEPAESRLTARADSESANFLTLNLADDVISGRRSTEDAAIMRTKLSRMEGAGKSSSYLDGLMFVPNDRFANPESPD